ncbi:3-hydroxybutyryl-CoA dehydrogenase [Bacillus piscicola]|uniref:3-hydroxybutyryl-CoA dehydrogenase n=1 Tax=Bacillus piscicola TaxID=1632684 RepID=UPI001F09A5CA|nr:3-hydroxybutyryl-CoA dehydrogenase [Bacillus piscicola]
MNIHTVMVIGAGQMGTGIAQVHAQAGYHVIWYDMEKKQLEKGMERIERNVERQREKNRLSEGEGKEMIKRIHSTSHLRRAGEADLIVEAVTENKDVKKRIFHEVDPLAPPHAILASNTSSLSITELASVTNRPAQVIGMHFMNPVPVMKLVEIIRGLSTAEETAETGRAVCESLGKTAIEVNDYPGFVSNRVLMPMINEAVYAVYEGVASPEAVDNVMTLGMNHPLGPLALADLIGLDTCLFIMETLHDGFGDDKYRPCPLLRNYVKAGWLGKKTGRGFYFYSS